jgi:signal transduction histidine kinase
MRVRDDGRGLSDASAMRNGRMGLAGMRERVAALGGTMQVANAPEGGLMLSVMIPGES